MVLWEVPIHCVLEHFYSNEIISSDIFLNFEKKLSLSFRVLSKNTTAQTYKTGKNYLSLKVAERLISDCLKYEEILIKKEIKFKFYLEKRS